LHFGEATELRRAFELVVLAGLLVLVATAVLDIGKNLLTWLVMDRAWNDPGRLSNAPVRMLWGFALARTVGLWTLAAACVLLLALADTATQKLRRALVAVRWEMLLLGALAVWVLMSPQTADVIRGWRVSHALITVGLSVIFAMLVRWTAVQNLRLQHRHWRLVEEGRIPEPHRVRVPLSGSHLTWGTFVGVSVVALAVCQVGLDAAGLPVGRGLIVPAILVGGLWLFGLPLPASPFLRGDRPVPGLVRRRLPRALGSAVFLIIGLAVLKAAATSVAYARNEDWWLLFAAIPPAVGLWRIATRTTNTMGWIEAVFGAGIGALLVALLVGGDPELSPSTLAFAGVTFTYGSLAFFNSYERTSLVNRVSARFLSHRMAKPFVATAVVGTVTAVVWFYVDPISVAPHIGTIGMTLMAMMALTLLGAGAVRLSEHARPPRLLSAFGIKRTPVVTLLVAWLLLAPMVVDQRSNDVRITESSSTQTEEPGFEDVWQRWAAANLGGAEPIGSDAERRVVPLILISSSGGGLRAAAWTAFVLDCVFEGASVGGRPCDAEVDRGDPLQRVALMSGVSGGSLGLGAYTAHVLDGVEGGQGSNSWVDETLGDDYLAAPIGWLFFVDVPRSLLGFAYGAANRSEMMERAWEASWPEDVPGLRRGLRDLWASAPEAPPLVFNGASVADGCRVNISALDVNGGSPEVPSCSGTDDGSDSVSGSLGATHDLADYLCPGDDVALSTAAGMSSRYPVVATAGRLAADPSRGCTPRAQSAVYVVDGGYLEGSGAGTLLDVWEALRDPVERFNGSDSGVCVVPFMIHIDNGYENPGVVGSQAGPRELAVPLLTVVNSSSGIALARAEAALAFEHPFTIGGEPVSLVERNGQSEESVDGRYVRLVTRAHPGVQAPLGWTLSQASIDDLRDQLALPENAAALDEIRRWLDGEIYCGGS
ncbi:MAG: hypothetical protein MUP76_03675, partial [Acidimicrobiia bacterium]|nr:hypothetical protein [Acidimicrobiia bacterium]